MGKKPDRNDPCYCGSEKKYKHCCMDKDKNQLSSKLGMISVGAVVAIVLGLLFYSIVLSNDDGQRNCPPGTTWSQEHQHCH